MISINHRRLESFLGENLPLATRFLMAIAIALCTTTITTSARTQDIDEYLRSPNGLLRSDCPTDSGLLLPKTYFTVCYDTQWRIPRWVAYFLSAPDLEGDVDRTEDFREDQAIANANSRSTLRDFAGSGYHRGHMAPAEAFDRSLVSMSTTFLLSNMAPQTPSLNSGKWRSLEAEVLKAVNAHRGVWVITGNLFAMEKRGRSSVIRTFTSLNPMTRSRADTRSWIGRGGRVAVPTHSYKAILVARSDNRLAGYGFILPNQRGRLPLKTQGYQVPIDEIEELIGIDLFSSLPDELEVSLEGDTPVWIPKREPRQ